MQCFKNTHWLEDDRVHRSSVLKRALYFLIRPLLSLSASHSLSKQMLQTLKPSLLLPGRGMPLETRRKWGSWNCNIKKSTILVQGTGTGWDVISWARLKPKKIIATDLFEFKDSWKEVSSYCQDKFGVTVEFYQASLEDHSFLASNTIDLCASDAVFEHCKDLKSVLLESFRVLKPHGSLYATYGPLWFSAGGDHFSGRGGLKNAYNHILMDSVEYTNYYRHHLQNNESFQSGGRYIELDLFSKLTTLKYYNLFRETGFTIDDFILEISPTCLKFKKHFPDLFNQVKLQNESKCTEDDLLISANFVRLIKPSKANTT